jgi:hypothetical protein
MRHWAWATVRWSCTNPLYLGSHEPNEVYTCRSRILVDSLGRCNRYWVRGLVVVARRLSQVIRESRGWWYAYQESALRPPPAYILLLALILVLSIILVLVCKLVEAQNLARAYILLPALILMPAWILVLPMILMLVHELTLACMPLINLIRYQRMRQ